VVRAVIVAFGVRQLFRRCIMHLPQGRACTHTPPCGLFSSPELNVLFIIT
jgi:hypothetical protein